MAGRSVLVDTNVIIYLIDGHRKAAEILKDKRLNFSFISEIELLSFKKLSREGERYILKILSESSILHSDEKITKLAIKIRKQVNLEIPDSIIAATAIRHNLPIVTADWGLAKVSGLQLIQYSL